METNGGFLNDYPQFGTMLPGNGQNRTLAAMAGDNTNAIDRWWHPQIAENEQFTRENYFVDKTNAFNEYMWNLNNEYNTPAAQMERMKEAGINPMIAAGAIGGSGAGQAQMIQGAQGNAGMNTNVTNPFQDIAAMAGTFQKGVAGVNELGKIIGYGKENKLNFQIATEQANNLKETANLNRWNWLRLKYSFRSFLREAEANAGATEQNVKNLQKLYDTYEQSIKESKAKENLYIEQENTQKEETKQKQLQNWELEFKKAFRQTFGVQLNDSDASMLVQMVLNGHGQELIDALGKMLKSLGEGIREKLPTIKTPPFLKPSKPIKINGETYNEKEVTKRRWYIDFKKQQKYIYEHKPTLQNYWKDKGGFEAYFEMKLKQTPYENW